MLLLLICLLSIKSNGHYSINIHLSISPLHTYRTIMRIKLRNVHLFSCKYESLKVIITKTKPSMIHCYFN